jgi:GNAT superfamily N-acetyltransferase
VTDFRLRQSTNADAAWIAELRAVVMRPDLERLGVFDPVRVRERFLTGFDAARTLVIEVEGRDVGSIAIRREVAETWIEHFYLAPELQGRGIGGAVLARVLSEHADARPFRVNVLRGSAAYRLYLRHGFVDESDDGVDLYLVRDALTA